MVNFFEVKLDKLEHALHGAHADAVVGILEQEAVSLISVYWCYSSRPIFLYLNRLMHYFCTFFH